MRAGDFDFTFSTHLYHVYRHSDDFQYSTTNDLSIRQLSPRRLHRDGLTRTLASPRAVAPTSHDLSDVE